MSNVESHEDKVTVTAEDAATKDEAFFKLTKSNAVILALVLVIILMVSVNIGSDSVSESVAPVAMAAEAPATPVAAVAAPMSSAVAATAPPAAASSSSEGIERNGEGRLFYTTIKIPANAETLYLSGSGASAKADGTWGNMEEQAIDTFNKFKATLEAQGWSMSDIVQVRCFAVAGEFGLLDFEGFNRGYSQFFGTAENPNKPVRSFVQVAALVNPGWLVEVEIRAARVPSGS